MAIKIVTDSSITVEPELVEKYDITVVPLSVTIEGTTYLDSDLSLNAFVEKMKGSKALPKTSQPPVGVFAETYEKVASTEDEIISIHITESLSGTVQAARQGAMLSGRDVTVLDSDFTDQGLKFQVIEAARLAKEGLSKDEILQRVKHVRENTELFIGISTLENLVKGGRVSRATGIVGSLLHVRIVMELKDRELGVMMRGRGNKTFTKWLDETVEHVASSGRKIREIGISHVEALDFSLKAKEALQKFVEKPISILDTNSTIATHTGPGAWAVMIDYE
ncbi:DegV family EDD domain-containing protein [Lactococcus garvieae]|nr:DegV family EDD domain-containing protein [Lactococcus garvieae]